MVKLKIVSEKQEQIEEAVFDIYNILLEAETEDVPAPQAQEPQQAQKPQKSKDNIGGVGRFGNLGYSTKLQAIIKIRDNIRRLKASLGNKSIPIYGKSQEWEQIDAILKKVQKKYNDNPSSKLFPIINQLTTKLAQELISPRTAAKPAAEPTPATEPATKPAQGQAVKQAAQPTQPPAATPVAEPAKAPAAKEQSQFIKSLNDLIKGFGLRPSKYSDHKKVIDGLKNLRTTLQISAGPVKNLEEQENTKQQKPIKFSKKFVVQKVNEYLDTLPEDFKNSSKFRKAVTDMFVDSYSPYFTEKPIPTQTAAPQPAVSAAPAASPQPQAASQSATPQKQEIDPKDIQREDPTTPEEMLNTISNLLQPTGVDAEGQPIHKAKTFRKDSKFGKLFYGVAMGLGLDPENFLTKSGAFDQMIKVQPYEGIIGDKHREVLQQMKSDIESGTLKESVIYERLFDKFLNKQKTTNKNQLFKLGNDRFKKYDRG
jgi:hypothetical protein